MVPDDDSGPPSARLGHVEVLALATAQADGQWLTTVRRIVRSKGEEAALGGCLLEAEPGFDARQ